MCLIQDHILQTIVEAEIDHTVEHGLVHILLTMVDRDKDHIVKTLLVRLLEHILQTILNQKKQNNKKKEVGLF